MLSHIINHKREIYKDATDFPQFYFILLHDQHDDMVVTCLGQYYCTHENIWEIVLKKKKKKNPMTDGPISAFSGVNVRKSTACMIRIL